MATTGMLSRVSAAGDTLSLEVPHHGLRRVPEGGREWIEQTDFLRRTRAPSIPRGTQDSRAGQRLGHRKLEDVFRHLGTPVAEPRETAKRGKSGPAFTFTGKPEWNH